MIEPPWPCSMSCGTAALTVFQVTGQVDVDHLLPGLLGELPRRADAEDACVRADDVEVTEL